MKKRFQAKQKRNLTTIGFFIQNQQIVNGIQGLSEQVNQLQLSSDSIEQCLNNSMMKIGWENPKSGFRSSLIDDTNEHISILRAYAQNSGNNTLLKELSMNLSELKRLTDLELVEMSKTILTRIEGNLTALVPYGITEATNAEFKKLIGSFEIAIPAKTLNVTKQKLNNESLEQEIDESDNILDKIDTLVNTVTKKYPEFHKGYYNVRKIAKYSTKPYMVVGKIINGATGEGLKGATITFSRTDEHATEIVKLSADKGGFYMRNIPEGIYRVTVTKIGFAPQEITIVVNSRELTEFTITMQKV